jgi:anti-sigma regulatory factor (Ser/Thr protein kinase)
LTEAGLPELADTAALLVSELVSNALLHGGGAATLGIRADRLGVKVWVGDRSPAPVPRNRPPGGGDELTEAGRGLLLVDRLAESWGWEDSPSGKAAWFRLSRDRSGE